jgi:hypothetical protein
MGSAPAGFEGAPEGFAWLEGCGSRVTEGWAISRAKTFRGTVIRPDAILASSYASSLCRRGSHSLAVCLHLLVVATRVLHDLVDHELRIPPHVEAFDAYLDGDLEATE